MVAAHRLALVLSVCLALLPVWAAPVRIEFFSEPGCEECAKVKSTVLPDLERRYAGRYAVEEVDLGEMTNYLRLVAYQRALGEVNAHTFMVLDGQRILSGYEEIAKGLQPALDRALENSTPVEPVKAAGPEGGPGAGLSGRMRQFTLAGILLAGLLDALNPCAMATMVFFISLLSASGVRGRRILVAGAAFALGCFATYAALGFGILRVIHLFSGFRLLRTVANDAMAALLAVLAILSFRDALRFRRSGDPGQIAIKLPGWLLRRGHAVMREGLGKRGVILGGLMAGAVVTALESVCTGQIYVPTLVMLIRSGGGQLSRAWGYLVAYNIMFVLPLVVLFVLVYQGLKWQVALEWSKRNVVLSKVLMGGFFILMTVLVLRL